RQQRKCPFSPSYPPRSFLDAGVPLPPGLTLTHLQKSISFIEKEADALVEIYIEQQNVFSALVGILGIKALDQFSVYEKVKHSFQAQQNFPDLKRRNAPPSDPKYFLESKASKRPWSIQSHYNHEGWYVVWRYLVDATRSYEPDRAVIIWRVDVVYLTRSDWKYEGSTAGISGGGRTHTFGVMKPASLLRGKSAYLRWDVRLFGGKPVPADD
ncbi:MAG: hypothetical protein ACREIR_10040, partial [Geminicoccaceae bacterium]